VAVENNVNPDTEASSDVSKQSAKSRTGKTVSLTPGQALEILQQSILECRRAGIKVRIAPAYHDNPPTIVVVVANCVVEDGKIVLVIPGSTGNEKQAGLDEQTPL
jgi:hypothetical protein